ncbi:MAG TPA: hypothetical protein VFP50_05385 [Anaeromyxobacteraceae bacterium]|nr:hypothetical protein [Anaeromyxobacteraceae bacterium]
MIRLSWPVAILATALVVLVARRPRLLFSRAFFPVLLVLAIILFVQYARGPRRPRDRD